MNRRKKEADQHKGWNISISGVFIAMVMGIVLISVVIIGLVIIFKKQLNELVTKIFEKITNESSGI